ncbi:MAG: heavy-metal-associated domain-containing protein [Burkholderiaceae bacterium]
MDEFKLPDMTCGHCVATVTRAVQALDAAAKVEIDLPTHQLRVQSSQPRAAIAAALSEAGYPPA